MPSESGTGLSTSQLKQLVDDLQLTLQTTLARAIEDEPDPSTRIRILAVEPRYRAALAQLPIREGSLDVQLFDALPADQKRTLSDLLMAVAANLTELAASDGPTEDNHVMKRAYASSTMIWALFGVSIVAMVLLLCEIVRFWPRATATVPCSTNQFVAANGSPTNPTTPTNSATNAASPTSPTAAPSIPTPPPSSGSERRLAGVPCEGDMIRMIVYLGGLGGLLHLASSLAKYVGNRQLRRSWLIYYWLAPLQGAALAPIVFLVLRVGVVGTPSAGQDTVAPMNHLGLYAFAAMTGLFSKQALEMLAEVFNVVFRRVSGKDSLDNAKSPTGTGK